MMNMVASVTIYLLFGDSKDLSVKSFIALGIESFYIIYILIVNLVLKVDVLNFIRPIFILDSLALSTLLQLHLLGL